ncbi:unnamed protein product [Prunus armeniaca]|uniref:Uncharacterized protein n=1 Tax=Prunus armeniaca TaxID=36596 RepID=A0A6J5WKL6_PRUAR|nr:unnamed protein product [Prunus armeniaca]
MKLDESGIRPNPTPLFAFEGSKARAMRRDTTRHSCRKNSVGNFRGGGRFECLQCDHGERLDP